MMTEAPNIIVRRLSQSPLLQPAQLTELTGSLATQFPDPRALAQELVRRGWLTIYQIQQVGLGRQASLILGPYILLDKLGQGGMGEVYKARHQRLGRVVALKVVRPDLLTDKEVVARFYREIEVISRISHPNIVHAYDAGPIGNALMLAMEFVDGIDLDRLVEKSGPLPIRDACEYLRQAALGLQHAHEKGLVHRDIKPSNLLVASGQGRVAGEKATVVSGQGPVASEEQRGHSTLAISHSPLATVKILDMGLARLQAPPPGSRTKNLTVLGGNSWTMGTPDYLAPEQAIDFHRADIRADIYSLGCTLFFLLAGKPPFEGTLPEKLMKHMQTEPEPLANVRPDAPPELGAILAKTLAKKPADRYQTPGELASELAGVLDSLPAPTGAAETARMPKADSTVDLPAVDTQPDADLLQLVTDDTSRAPAKEKKSRGRRRLLLVMVAVVLGVVGFIGLAGVMNLGANSKPAVWTMPTIPLELPGVQYGYYEGNWNKLPQFEKLTPIKSGTAANMSLNPRKRNDHFAMVFTALLKVDKPGKYTFTLRSDDGSRLFLNDKLVVDSDGLHSVNEKSGATELAAGKHPLKVTYLQGTGDYILEVYWQGPDMPARARIPDAVLLLPISNLTQP